MSNFMELLRGCGAGKCVDRYRVYLVDFFQSFDAIDVPRWVYYMIPYEIVDAVIFDIIGERMRSQSGVFFYERLYIGFRIAYDGKRREAEQSSCAINAGHVSGIVDVV